MRRLLKQYQALTCFLYRYTPRFVTGHCIMTVKGQYRYYRIICPGEKILLKPEEYLIEAKYFNWFGEVFEPELTSAFRIRQ